MKMWFVLTDFTRCCIPGATALLMLEMPVHKSMLDFGLDSVRLQDKEANDLPKNGFMHPGT
ncbi:unnamed protein product [Acanthoscelides obtectus]|uniref:Uncharacterized protein n=1 Tax=Acanthoscelides obtectus TaxID=200917 RepID=A0A9P0K9P8_ACAOB|nr:unnamed protein product [Acanthoscelides obtectus]CAK1672664.1 hypothetical protein AOBTE_LOCUS29029 [Acanthoscelides obtectus]